VIGTSSVRRASILRNLRPDLEIKLLRGNVQRRLARLDAGEYDAIILAMAGLTRLGLAERGHPLSEKVMMPPASQGVIAIQIATSDGTRKRAMEDAFAAMHCEATSLATRAERAMLAHLDGSCRTPIGAIADLSGETILSLTGMVLSTDGCDRFEASASCKLGDDKAPEALGVEVAEALLSQCGGRGFLA
jgi:hydroxymethylbilane synthase